MLRHILMPICLLTHLYIVAPAHAQAPQFDADFFKQVSAEFKEKPQLVLWADVKNLRTSSFYTSASNTITGLLHGALAQSKCLKKLTIADLDYAVMMASDLDSGKSERGYMAISGNLGATALLKCLAAENKWTPTTLKNYPVYEEAGGTVKSYFYALGNDAIVVVAGDWATKIDPGKNVFGAAKISGFAKSRIFAAQMDKAPKGAKLKSFSGEVKAATDLEFAGSIIFLKEKDAIDAQKQVDSAKQQGAGAGMTFANTLKVTRTKTRLDGTMKMTSAEFIVVVSLLNTALFGGSSPPPPTPSKKPIP
ncbi:MAG: hypothetical protein CVU65_12565 [Deltaproteobacteria bacterium HGW-Deltaproteobacteria-22]|jgi:hypothetical protein|nr:MAG: hypothetical protein CVU65_12565 [Deltaproteobacteria bacterium HGW-Deltaproteobacteria-22]